MTLDVKNLNKTFGSGGPVAAGIFDISFRLEPGKFFTLLGPSGCGKTTTLRCVAGLQEPTSGYVAVGDRVLYDSAKDLRVALNKRGFGMVFQSYAIWPHMTVEENVSFPLRVGSRRNLSSTELKAKVNRALEVVDLGGFGKRPATRLSGGQQQRVALARAIVAEPKLLLLDEPLSNLDASLRDIMRAELKRLQRQLGITTIYVTHDQAEALEMSDEIAVLSGGHIVQKGSPQEIYFRPTNRFVATFIGSTNLLKGVAPSSVAAGEISTVQLAGGQIFHCLFPKGAQGGQQVEVSIRPEATRLARGQTSQSDSNTLHGKVESVAFQGTSFRYGVCGTEFRAVVHGPADDCFDIGSDVTLMCDPSNALVVSDA